MQEKERKIGDKPPSLRTSGGRPTLSRDETLDDGKVSEFVKWFVKNDPLANVISSRSPNIIFEAGYAPFVPLGYNPSIDKKFDNLMDWFVAKSVQDIKNMRGASKTDFNDFLDNLGDAGSKTLITSGEIAIKYDLNFKKFIYEKEIQKIPAGKERELFKQNLMDDDILGAEMRILGWLYHEWFGDWYKIPERDKKERRTNQTIRNLEIMQPTKMLNHPQLSEGTIKRMRSTGLDPDEMSEEQLEAIESLDNPAKSHWLVKPFIYIGGFLQILALFALVSADWGALIDYGVTGSILLYIGYRIQRRIAAKKLLQASINGLQPQRPD